VITLGLEEPVVDPKLWVEMEGLRVRCDRSLLVFWGRPFEIAKSLLADVEEEQKLKIPALRGAMGRYGGSEVCVYRLFIGSPAAVIAAELLIAVGVKKFLVFGGCGAIHPSVKIYDLVIPTWGIREEGASYHYLPPDVVPRPSERIVKVLEEELKPVARSLGIGLHLGGVWTTDALFRETRDKVRKYSEMNVLCVDMESTALMSVAMYRGVELGIVHVVTDQLYGDKWTMYSDDNRMTKVEKEAVQTLIKVLNRI